MHKNLQKTSYSKLSIKAVSRTFNEFQKEFFLAFIILIATSFLIYILTHYIISEKENVIDYQVFLLVKQIINPTGLKVAKLVTVLGTGNFLVPAYIFIVLYLRKRNYICLAYIISITAITSLLLGWLLKIAFHRNRPIEHLTGGAGGYSFPSGHALGGFIFSGILMYLVWKTRYSLFSKWSISVLVALLGICIGISRIYLHVHYATDVLGSFFIAMWWLSFMYLLFKFLFRNNISKTKEQRNTAFFPIDYYLNN
jgi:undecaprenyl-diphosphatase